MKKLLKIKTVYNKKNGQYTISLPLKKLSKELKKNLSPNSYVKIRVEDFYLK